VQVQPLMPEDRHQASIIELLNATSTRARTRRRIPVWSSAFTSPFTFSLPESATTVGTPWRSLPASTRTAHVVVGSRRSATRQSCVAQHSESRRRKWDKYGGSLRFLAGRVADDAGGRSSAPVVMTKKPR
jgi:hypothetical protein